MLAVLRPRVWGSIHGEEREAARGWSHINLRRSLAVDDTLARRDIHPGPGEPRLIRPGHNRRAVGSAALIHCGQEVERGERGLTLTVQPQATGEPRYHTWQL